MEMMNLSKIRDYIYMDVVDINGKRLGYIKDILINFHEKKVIGFDITPYKLFGKNFNVMKEDVLYFNKYMVVKKISKEKCLKFEDINKMYVIDRNSNILGVVKDLIFDEDEMNIQGVIIATNILNLFLKRQVLLAKNLILGEKNLFYMSTEEKINLECIPNKFLSIGEGDIFEKRSK